MLNLPERNLNQTNKQRTQRMKIKVQIKKQKLLQSKRTQIQSTNAQNIIHLTQKQKRKMQNRQSAKRSRKKKKNYLQFLETQIKKSRIVLSNCPICKFNSQEEELNSIQKDETKQNSVDKKKSNSGRKPNEHGKSSQQISKIKKIRKDVQKQRNRTSAKESRQRVNQRISVLEEQNQRLKQQIEKCEICKYYRMDIQIPQQNDYDSESSQLAIIQNQQQQIIQNPQVTQQNELIRMRQSQSSIWKLTNLCCILIVMMLGIYYRQTKEESYEDGRLLITASTNSSEFNNQSDFATNNVVNDSNSVRLPQLNKQYSSNTTLSIDSELKEQCQKSQNQYRQYLASLQQQHKTLDKQLQRYCSISYPQLCALNLAKRIRLLGHEFWARDILKKKRQKSGCKLSEIDEKYFAKKYLDIQIEWNRNVQAFKKLFTQTTGPFDYAYKNHINELAKLKNYKDSLYQNTIPYDSSPIATKHSQHAINTTASLNTNTQM